MKTICQKILEVHALSHCSTPVCQHTYGVLAHQKAKVCYAHQNKGVLAHHMHYYIALKLRKHMHFYSLSSAVWPRGKVLGSKARGLQFKSHSGQKKACLSHLK